MILFIVHEAYELIWLIHQVFIEFTQQIYYSYDMGFDVYIKKIESLSFKDLNWLRIDVGSCEFYEIMNLESCGFSLVMVSVVACMCLDEIK